MSDERLEILRRALEESRRIERSQRRHGVALARRWECLCFHEHGVGARRVDPDCPVHGDGGRGR